MRMAASSGRRRGGGADGLGCTGGGANQSRCGGPDRAISQNLVALRGSGERVIIDGPCLSACTMVLGVIPRERICVTPRARLGFHAAWHPGDNGRPVHSRAATRLLMEIYPEHVRSWITRRGGLTPRMMYLSGRELAAMYQTCD